MFQDVSFDSITLPESWVRLMWHAFQYGRAYNVEKGSRAGQKRLSLDSTYLKILKPEIRPFSPMCKDGCITPINEEMINDYFLNYIYGYSDRINQEQHNYSSYIYPMVQAFIKYYSTYGFGNAHCTIRVGEPFSFLKYFEPIKDEITRHSTTCLVSIDTKIINDDAINKLIFYINFRSWDIFSGYLLDMTALQLLKELMAMEISCASKQEVVSGPTIAICKDLHLYEEDWPAAKAWVGKVN